MTPPITSWFAQCQFAPRIPGDDLFLTREAAEAELREILEDEPDWKDVLRVVPIDLDEVSCTMLSPHRQRTAAFSGQIRAAMRRFVLSS